MEHTFRYNQLVDRYIATLNEPDPGARRKLIDELWAENGSYTNRLFVCTGHDEVDMAMTAMHDEYFAKGFSFRSANNAYGHHQGVKFNWVLVTTATGEVDTFGEEFLILDDEGRISVDYQFGVRPPAI